MRRLTTEIQSPIQKLNKSKPLTNERRRIKASNSVYLIDLPINLKINRTFCSVTFEQKYFLKRTTSSKYQKGVVERNVTSMKKTLHC